MMMMMMIMMMIMIMIMIMNSLTPPLNLWKGYFQEMDVSDTTTSGSLVVISGHELLFITTEYHTRWWLLVAMSCLWHRSRHQSLLQLC